MAFSLTNICLHVVTYMLVFLDVSAAKPELQESPSAFLSKATENAIAHLQAVARSADPYLPSNDRSNFRSQKGGSSTIDDIPDHALGSLGNESLKMRVLPHNDTSHMDLEKELYQMDTRTLVTRTTAGAPGPPSSWVQLHSMDPSHNMWPVSLLSYLDVFQRFRKGSTTEQLTRDELRSFIVAILSGFKYLGPTGQHEFLPTSEDIDPLEYSMTDLRGSDPSRLTILYRVRAPDLVTANTWKSMIEKNELRHGFQNAALTAYKKSHSSPKLIPGLEDASMVQMPFSQVFEQNQEFENAAQNGSTATSLTEGLHFASGLWPKPTEGDIISRTVEASNHQNFFSSPVSQSVASEQPSNDLPVDRVLTNQAQPLSSFSAALKSNASSLSSSVVPKLTTSNMSLGVSPKFSASISPHVNVSPPRQHSSEQDSSVEAYDRQQSRLHRFSNMREVKNMRSSEVQMPPSVTKPQQSLTVLNDPSLQSVSMQGTSAPRINALPPMTLDAARLAQMSPQQMYSTGSSLRQGQQVSAGNRRLSWNEDTPLDDEELRIADEALLRGGGAYNTHSQTPIRAIPPPMPGGGPVYSADISTLQARFYRHDRDGDSYLNYDEVAALVNEVWATPRSTNDNQAFANILASCDGDGDGKFSFKEVSTVVRNIELYQHQLMRIQSKVVFHRADYGNGGPAKIESEPAVLGPLELGQGFPLLPSNKPGVTPVMPWR